MQAPHLLDLEAVEQLILSTSASSGGAATAQPLTALFVLCQAACSLVHHGITVAHLLRRSLLQQLPQVGLALLAAAAGPVAFS